MSYRHAANWEDQSFVPERPGRHRSEKHRLVEEEDTITETAPSIFGPDRPVYVIPGDGSTIIVAVNDGFGIKPRHLFLPHQLYVEDVRKLLAKGPSRREVLVMRTDNNWLKVQVPE